MSDEPTESQIVDALSASGFLLEQEVATAFEAAGFYAKTGRAFTDPEEGTSREIDVHGFWRSLHDEARRRAIYVQLLCECKNTSNPFVFLARRKSVADLERSPSEYQFPMRFVQVPHGTGYTETPPFRHFGLSAHHYQFQKELKAVQIVRLNRRGKEWAADNNSVFTSLVYPLAKALRDFQKSHKYTMGPMKPGMPVEATGGQYAHASLYFPMVVVPSPLWIVDVHRDPVVPERVPFITLERELKSTSLTGRFAIDFVQQEHLPDFLASCVIPFASSVKDALWPG
ncbi:MAG: hypothetical protein WB808_06715 [Candidatus Dormiibacterota bacterium]